MKKNDPIGIFDSGLGGLTVAKQIIKVLPHENIIYFGDTARVPYGPRSPEIIKKFSEQNTNFLLAKKVKCIIIACNTSSAVAAEYLQKKFHKVPIFEVIEPASSFASKKGKRIGVIGTRATIGSGAYEKKIRKYSKLPAVFSKACPLFVPFIEEGEIDSPALKSIARQYLADLRIKKIDTLIMGCTHYPIIERIIEKEVDNHVEVIDPGVTVAQVVKEHLSLKNLLNNQKKKGNHTFFVTDLTKRFIAVAEMFLGHKIAENIKKVDLNQ